MKRFLIPLRLLFLLCFSVVVYVVFFYDAAREAWKKRTLGHHYEGPAE